jgi:hypothetical protein
LRIVEVELCRIGKNKIPVSGTNIDQRAEDVALEWNDVNAPEA